MRSILPASLVDPDQVETSLRAILIFLVTMSRSASCSKEFSGRSRKPTVLHYAETVDVEACLRYVLGRQTSQGGFCFYAYPEWGVEEPNAPDTHAAVAILRLLGSCLPRPEQCRAWLEAEQDSSGGYSTFVIGYATLKTLHLIGAQPKRDPRPYLSKVGDRLGLADSSSPKPPAWLMAARGCVELWQAWGVAITETERQGIAAALNDLRRADGGYGTPGSNLPETAAALVLAVAAELPVDPDILTYTRRCEGSPYGFNITPWASSSDLETHHAALQVFRHFSVRSQDPMLTRRFVAACQSSVGGFGRVPGAIPRLDDSLRALQILSMLADPGGAGT